MSGAVIIDGKYTADHRGGVPVGTFSVEIEAHRVDPRYARLEEEMPNDVEAELPREQYLPEKYNRHTTLELVVPPGSGRIRKDFHLQD
jgi:hypothetical protein